MNTFFPYSSFVTSMQCLDKKRLGKQRVEAFQIIKILEGQQSAWQNHPCAKMWKGHTNALKYYLFCAIDEWVKRGFHNTMELPLADFPIVNPPWLGYEPLHASHRANLLRKDFEYYSKFKWKEEPYNGYYWACEVIGEKTKKDKLYWENKIQGVQREVY